MALVKLYGHLRDSFIDEVNLAVRSVPEIVRALGANFPNFEAEVIKDERLYKVIIDDIDATEEYLGACPIGDKSVVKIIPVIQGSKSTFATILIGAALIAAGQVWAAQGLVPGTMAAAGASAVTSIGVSLVVSGVTSLLYSADTLETKEKPDANPSYLFNGVVNTTAQGQPVPIGYGRLRIGSAVISAGIERDQGFFAQPGTVAGSLS
jgi:predicted phage tail protein